MSDLLRGLTPLSDEELERRRVADERRLAEVRAACLPRVLQAAGVGAPVPLASLSKDYPADRKRVEWGLQWLTRLPRSVLLYGPPGRGKTHFARALATETAAAGGSVRFLLWEDFFTQVCRRETPDLAWPALLVIDQLNNLRGEGRTEAFVGLWEARERAGRPIIAITNRPPDIWQKEGWDETVTSRLGGMERLRFAGPDRRRK